MHLSLCFVASDSNVKHSLGDGAYEKRVSECARAAKTLQMKWPEIQKLRDATLPQLMAMEEAMDEEAFYRARHVIMENDRTQQSENTLEHTIARRKPCSSQAFLLSIMLTRSLAACACLQGCAVSCSRRVFSFGSADDVQSRESEERL